MVSLFPQALLLYHSENIFYYGQKSYLRTVYRNVFKLIIIKFIDPGPLDILQIIHDTHVIVFSITFIHPFSLFAGVLFAFITEGEITSFSMIDASAFFKEVGALPAP